MMNAPNIYIEVSQSALKVLAANDGLEMPLERLENGRMAPLSRERVTATVREFLKKHGARPGLRAYCAIGARGVSLRRLTLPAASGEELERLLLLQIEREFPLSPDELAWGFRALGPQPRLANGSGKTQELLVVAVKKESLQEYADIFSECGLIPLFTLGALARSHLVSHPPASYAVLDIGRTQSELISFENGAPSSIRVIAVSEQNISGEAASVALAKSLPADSLGQKLYLTGAVGGLSDLATQLPRAIGRSSDCEWIEMPSGEGCSAAILGLKKMCEAGGDAPLILQVEKPATATVLARPTPWKWAALAVLLLLLSLSLRYAEAVIQKPRLARKISDLKNYRDKLPKVDRELGFLQYLKTNQPPYLDPLFVMANAAPPGARIETISMNRRGELALRASMQNSTQVGDFRSKLINSGVFSAVTVDEQTTTPDRQKVVVRITGQWKPSSDRKSLTNEVPNAPIEKTKSAPNKPKTAISTNAAILARTTSTNTIPAKALEE